MNQRQADAKRDRLGLALTQLSALLRQHNLYTIIRTMSKWKAIVFVNPSQQRITERRKQRIDNFISKSCRAALARSLKAWKHSTRETQLESLKALAASQVISTL